MSTLPGTVLSATATTTVATLSGGGRANQDHAVVGERSVALLDGATSWLPQDPARDGRWYARALGAALEAAGLDDPARDLADVVEDALAAVLATGDVTPGVGPVSTVSLARWDGDRVEVLVLGDSPAVLLLSGRPEPVVVADDRLAAVAADGLAAVAAHLRAGHGFDERHADLVARLQRHERTRRNVEGGYWIAEGDPGAARHAVREWFPADEVLLVALLCDGAAASVTEYGVLDWAGLADALRRDPAKLLRRTHLLEAQDPDGVRWPRTKRHDDKTVVVRAG